MRVQITLRSGAQIEAEVTNLETGRNHITQNLTTLTWTTPQLWLSKLHYVCLDQIDAIVLMEDFLDEKGTKP